MAMASPLEKAGFLLGIRGGPFDVDTQNDGNDGKGGNPALNMAIFGINSSLDF